MILGARLLVNAAWIEIPHLPAGPQPLRTLCWRMYRT